MRATRATKSPRTTFEHRLCDVCGRLTVHKVTHSRDGMGRSRHQIPECLDHQVWVGGRIDVRRNGEWVTLVPASEKR